MTSLLLSFMAGLAGSGHCLGMCGGFIAALTMAAPHTPAQRRMACNLAYQAGRTVTYTLLGILAGAASRMALVTQFKQLAGWLFVAANVMVMLFGLATAAGLGSMSLSKLDGAAWGWLGRILQRASQQVTLPVFFNTGLAMGLMPCGLVYGMLITTATSGSWLQGGGMMLAFGLGTMPALLAYGQLASSLSAAAGKVMQRVLGVIVALLGTEGVLKALLRLELIQPFHLW